MEIKQETQVSSQSSSLLCTKIVAYRSLGFNKEVAIEAMQELQRRADAGDNFNFTELINEQLKSLPKFDPNRLENIKIKDAQIKG
jgi:Holliday junction resolvasome RuvABC DNA-binding subunit